MIFGMAMPSKVLISRILQAFFKAPGVSCASAFDQDVARVSFETCENASSTFQVLAPACQIVI